MVLRILIADDHDIVRRGLRGVLESRSDWIVCAEARDGREAVDLTRQHQPDVALVDVSLPVLSGIEATRQICRSSLPTEVLIGQALHAGARGYLLKSEADEQIIQAVTALARHRPYFSSRVSETLLN